MKLLLLFFFLFIGGCSTRELSFAERDRGVYLFNLKMKEAYSAFFKQSLFSNGSQAYAGPAFVQFTNGQPLKVVSVRSTRATPSTYVAKDGSKLEFIKHDVVKRSDGLYRLGFTGLFQSVEVSHKQEFDLVIQLKCKAKVDCTYDLAADTLIHGDPYEFSISFNYDLFTPEAPDYSQFSDAEVTAIKSRYIFSGMTKKAVELSIGNTTQYLHGFYNLNYENDFIKTFEFRYNNALPLFSRH